MYRTEKNYVGVNRRNYSPLYVHSSYNEVTEAERQQKAFDDLQAALRDNPVMYYWNVTVNKTRDDSFINPRVSEKTWRHVGNAKEGRPTGAFRKKCEELNVPHKAPTIYDEVVERVLVCAGMHVDKKVIGKIVHDMLRKRHSPTFISSDQC